MTKWNADIVVDAFGLTVRIPISFAATDRKNAEWLAAWICGERRFENLEKERQCRRPRPQEKN